MNKPRVVKDYEKVDPEVLEQIKLQYPYGFDKALVTFKNQKGAFVSALPFETEDRYYLIRMTRLEAQQIIEDDEDYDDDGNLKDTAKEAYEDKYDDDTDLDEIIDVDTEDDD
jgi:hypothetical protein